MDWDATPRLGLSRNKPAGILLLNWDRTDYDERTRSMGTFNPPPSWVVNPGKRYAQEYQAVFDVAREGDQFRCGLCTEGLYFPTGLSRRNQPHSWPDLLLEEDGLYTSPHALDVHVRAYHYPFVEAYACQACAFSCLTEDRIRSHYRDVPANHYSFQAYAALSGRRTVAEVTFAYVQKTCLREPPTANPHYIVPALPDNMVIRSADSRSLTVGFWPIARVSFTQDQAISRTPGWAAANKALRRFPLNHRELRDLRRRVQRDGPTFTVDQDGGVLLGKRPSPALGTHLASQERAVFPELESLPAGVMPEGPTIPTPELADPDSPPAASAPVFASVDIRPEFRVDFGPAQTATFPGLGTVTKPRPVMGRGSIDRPPPTPLTFSMGPSAKGMSNAGLPPGCVSAALGIHAAVPDPESPTFQEPAQVAARPPKPELAADSVECALLRGDLAQVTRRLQAASAWVIDLQGALDGATRRLASLTIRDNTFQRELDTANAEKEEWKARHLDLQRRISSLQ